MDEMINQGIDLHTGFKVASLARTPRGIAVDNAAGGRLEGYDCVVWAVGRTPNTRDLRLKAAGVMTKANGAVVVDEYQRTNVPGIFAVGDVTGKLPLTPVAIAAGRRLAERLFNEKPQRRLDYDSVPSVVFSHPPVGTVGLTEAQARERYGEAVTVYESRFTPMRHALTGHDATTAMKLVCAGVDETVVGVHIIGDSADEILQGFAVVVKLGVKKSDLDDTIALHPTSAEELVTMKHPQPPAITDEAVEAGIGWREAS